MAPTPGARHRLVAIPEFGERPSYLIDLFDHPRRDLDPRRESEFGEDVLDVPLDRPRGDAELGSDRLVGQPPRHEFGDLVLALGEKRWLGNLARLVGGLPVERKGNRGIEVESIPLMRAASKVFVPRACRALRSQSLW